MNEDAKKLQPAVKKSMKMWPEKVGPCPNS